SADNLIGHGGYLERVWLPQVVAVDGAVAEGESRKRGSRMTDQLKFRWIKLVAIGQGVNVDDRCLEIPGLVELHNVQSASDDEIRSLPQFKDKLVSQHFKNASKERMVLGDHAFGLGRY